MANSYSSRQQVRVHAVSERSCKRNEAWETMGSGISRVQNIKKLKGHCKCFTFIELPWNHSCSYQWAPAFQCAKQCSFCDYTQWELALWQVLTVTTKRLHDERIVFWQVSYENAQPYVFKMEMSRGRKRTGGLHQKENKID